MRDCLRLYRRVDHNPLEILGRDRARLVRHRKALLDESHQLLLAQALAPACQRRAVERRLMTEAQLAAEELEIRILDPPRTENLIRQVVHVLEDEEARHQPGRQAGLTRARLAHRAKAPVEKLPVDPFGQPHQRMTHVDDLIERRTKQVLLAIVARSCHRAPQYR